VEVQQKPHPGGLDPLGHLHGGVQPAVPGGGVRRRAPIARVLRHFHGRVNEEAQPYVVELVLFEDAEHVPNLPVVGVLHIFGFALLNPRDVGPQDVRLGGLRERGGERGRYRRERRQRQSRRTAAGAWACGHKKPSFPQVKRLIGGGSRHTI